MDGKLVQASNGMNGKAGIEPNDDDRSRDEGRKGGARQNGGGQRKAVPCWVPLAAERIFMEYSGPDKDGWLSVSDVVRYLKEIYDCEVSDSYVRTTLLPAMLEFSAIEPRVTDEQSLIDFFRWKMDSNLPIVDKEKEGGIDDSGGRASGGSGDGGFDDSGVDGETKENKPSRKKGLYWFRSNRLLSDCDIEFLISMIDANTFMIWKDASDLARKLRSLQFRGNRGMAAFLLDSDSEYERFAAERRSDGRGVRDSKKHAAEVKPGMDSVLVVLSELYEAIVEKKTISFVKLKYSTRKTMLEKFGSVTPFQGDGEGVLVSDVTPYGIRYEDGHCFLLTSCRGRKKNKDSFEVHRVDLIKNLKVSEPDSDNYIPLKNIQAPVEYFRGSMNGCGGRRKKITLRCSKKALHYVIERFSGCEDWDVRDAEAKSNDDGRPLNEKNWYEVTFSAPVDGIGYWAQKFLGDIDVIEPVSLRNRIAKRVAKNPYCPVVECTNGSCDAG